MALDQAYPLLARISSIVAIQVLMLKPSSVQNPVPGVRASWSQLRYAPAGRNYDSGYALELSQTTMDMFQRLANDKGISGISIGSIKDYKSWVIK